MPESLPVNVEIKIFTGTTFRREFRWLPDGTNPQDFTGWTGRMPIGTQSGHPVLLLTTEDGSIELGPDGKIELYVDPADTAPLKQGTYSYQLDLRDGGGDITRFLRGRCEIVRDVEPT